MHKCPVLMSDIDIAIKDMKQSETVRNSVVQGP